MRFVTAPHLPILGILACPDTIGDAIGTDESPITSGLRQAESRQVPTRRDARNGTGQDMGSESVYLFLRFTIVHSIIEGFA